MHYYSFVEQTIHYFDRPHEQVATQPIESPAAWRGSELPPVRELAYELQPSEVDELLAAVSACELLDRPTLELTAEDFPLTQLAPIIAGWRQELAQGRGFQLVRGVPVERWSQSQSELFFWCFGLHLGRPGQQNPQGHLLGHVKDISAQLDDPTARLYKTAANIDYHCDAADVVGLLCLNKALRGGHSRIASSVSVFNTLCERRPDLAALLFEPFHLDVRDKEVNAAGSTLPIPPCRFAGGVLRTFYHADYFRSAMRHADVPRLTELAQELLQTYEAIALEPGMYVDMDLQPGDIQLLSNHTALHARTAYEDDVDPDKRRHLLRLWLSL